MIDMRKTYCLSLMLICLTSPSQAFAWHDKTHISIAKAAGYEYWFNAAGADIIRSKYASLEDYNHYFNNNKNDLVTESMVLDQVKRYNGPNDEEGHLYGAIIASLREYQKSNRAGKYAEYHKAFAAHYVGDLSQPLHNIRYDTFNETCHVKSDGIVEEEIMDNINRIIEKMYDIPLAQDTFEDDLTSWIAKIANVSRKLGLKLRAENRNMTKEEAYGQLGHSASLLRAILKAGPKNVSQISAISQCK
jgi:hypothetical protein